MGRCISSIATISTTLLFCTGNLALTQQQKPTPSSPPPVASSNGPQGLKNAQPVPISPQPQDHSDQSKNVGYVHPPGNLPAIKLNADPNHPAPQPNTGPKSPAVQTVDRGPLPSQIPPGALEEDTDNLVRNWKNLRPMNERQQAAQQSLAMPSEPHQAAAPSTAGQAAPTLGTTGWEQIGYGDFNTDNVHHEAGRIRQASYAYDNPQGITTLWLGATGGGVWRGIDLFFAVAFVPVSDNLPGSPSVGAFLVQPGNSNNILIGSGDSYRYGGTGMYKTTDEGATWSAVYPTDGTSWPSAFQKVLIDLSDGTNQTVLAEGDTGIWRSTNFGSTWTQVYNGATSDLVQDPVNTYIWYAGAPGVGVLRSTSYGTSFGAIGSGMATPGRISVAVSAAAPWHVYAISATTDWKYLSGIWRSDDYGDGTWNLIETSDHISGAAQAFHTTSINVDPTNADLVIAGMAGSQITYNATAATPTWTYSSSFDEGHADHTGYTFEGGTNNIISTTDGGVYVLDKNALTVSGSLNYATNLNVQQVFGPVGDLACSLDSIDECIAGLQDNGTITINRNNTPPLLIVGGGDGNAASIAPNNPSELFQMGDGGRWYTTNGAASWVGDYGGCLPNNFYATTMIDQTPPNGFTPYIYTFSIPYTGSTSSYVYYKTVNPNCDWAQANPSHPFDTNSFSPRSMDASNDQTGYVFYVVGWGTGRLYVLDSYSTGSLGGTMTYVDRTPPVSLFSSFNDSQIAADRSSSRPYTVTYTTGSARPSQAFISNDRGQTWTEVTGDLADKLSYASFWKLVANPGDQRQLFLGTDQGIYRSDNGGVNWYRYMEGMPAVADIFGLELNYDYSSPPLLHLGTYGRGAWDRQVASDAVLSNVTLIPTQVVRGQGSEVVVWLDRPAPQDITVSLTSSNPSVFAVPSSITVSQGYSNAGLIFPTAAVTSQTPVTVTGSYNQVQYSAVLTVTLAPTSTSVVSSLNPSNYGQTVTFTASVTSSYGSPTGTVTFYDGASAIGSGGLSGGHATVAAALAGGVHSIKAVYAGAGTFAGSTSAVLTQTVHTAASSTLESSSANPAIFGNAVTFSAKVSSSAGTPSGSVTFKDGVATLGVGTLSGGTATYTTSTLAVGSHSITAVYGGNADFTGSTSVALAQTITKAATSTSVTSSANPASFGKTITLTAKVKSATSGTPGGAVTFKDGTALLATPVLSGGTATFTTTTLAVGSHSITVVYGGDADFTGSISPVVTQTVTVAATSTVVTSSANPAPFGKSITLTAQVKSSTSGTPGGSVTFKDGTTVLGTRTLSSGTATLITTTLAVGSHSITVVYSGDADFTGSTSPALTQTITEAATSTVAASSVDPSIHGNPVTFTGTVKSSTSGTPGGSVTFKDGTAVLGTSTLSGGMATFTTTTLAVGSHSITVVYGGGADFTGSTSPVKTQIVNP
jgi:Big-like domain-containing protein